MSVPDRVLESGLPSAHEAARDKHVPQALGDPQSPYLTTAEACRHLRYKSLKAFYDAIHTLDIPHRKCGPKKLLFKKDELDRWLAGEPKLRLLAEARSGRER